MIEDLRRQLARFRGSEFKLFRALEQILDSRFRPDSQDELDQVMAYLGNTDANAASDVGEAEIILASIVAQNPKELRRMADYERRAISGRGRALRRLTLARIEAERRHAGAARLRLHLHVNPRLRSDRPYPPLAPSPIGTACA